MTSGTQINTATPPKVAIVDDDHYVRSSLASLLRSCGVAVTAFERAQALLDAPDFEFAAVISDIQMPEVSGLELAAALAGRRPRLPIILMTAFPEEVGRREAATLGVAYYIEKPFEPDDLLAKLWAVLRANNLVG